MFTVHYYPQGGEFGDDTSTYTYCVRAYNAAGDSAYSNAAGAKTLKR